MNFKEALLFSRGKIQCSSKDGKYMLCIEEREEEYEPASIFPPKEPQKCYRSVFYILVLRAGANEAHKSFHFYSIEDCEEFLEDKGINTEDGWEILEEV